MDRTVAWPEMSTATTANDEAYRRLVEPYRGELHAHCYRMLGSVHDADDALQDALLRAWRALGRFEGRSSLRSWLYRIATNTCLDLIARRQKRVLPIDHGAAADPHADPGEPIVESIWLEPYPDERLGVEDGFAAPEAATSGARASSSRSSPRSSTYRRRSARCWSCVRCSGSRPPRSPRRSTRRPRRSTARCSAPARPSTSG